MLMYLCGFRYKRKKSQQNYFVINFALHCSLVFLFFLYAYSQNAQKTVPEIIPRVIRTIPHDTLAFTQGLLFKKSKLFESTGLYNRSSLRRIDAQTGTIEKKIPIQGVFAEGLVFLDGFLIQLTWKSGYAIRYSFPDLQKVGVFKYDGEGWGLTSSYSSNIIWSRDWLYTISSVFSKKPLYVMSNGSDTLYWRDTKFRIKKQTPVTLRGKPLKNLNELEFAQSKIYANVWYSDFVFEIDPQNGSVQRIINCYPLIKKIGSLGKEDVLNGIAYNDEKSTFFITGKNWPLIFEVSIP